MLLILDKNEMNWKWVEKKHHHSKNMIQVGLSWGLWNGWQKNEKKRRKWKTGMTTKMDHGGLDRGCGMFTKTLFCCLQQKQLEPIAGYENEGRGVNLDALCKSLRLSQLHLQKFHVHAIAIKLARINNRLLVLLVNGSPSFSRLSLTTTAPWLKLRLAIPRRIVTSLKKKIIGVANVSEACAKAPSMLCSSKLSCFSNSCSASGLTKLCRDHS